MTDRPILIFPVQEGHSLCTGEADRLFLSHDRSSLSFPTSEYRALILVSYFFLTLSIARFCSESVSGRPAMA